MTTKAKKSAKRLDKRTSERLAALAGRVLKAGGVCTAHEAKRLAACVLSQVEAQRKA